MTTEVPAGARTFEAAPESVGRARRFVRDAVESLDAGHLVDAATLLASELVTNAVLHARTAVTVEVARVGDGRIRVTVCDRNDLLPKRRTFSPTAGSGRGLHLVESVAADWGAEPVDSGGKAVWFDLV